MRKVLKSGIGGASDCGNSESGISQVTKPLSSYKFFTTHHDVCNPSPNHWPKQTLFTTDATLL